MDDDALVQAARWLDEGRRVALATVIRAWDSAPRPVGSQLAVDQAGTMAGSVSGGCVEASVVNQALRALEDGEPRLLAYGVTDEMAWEVGVPCGGRLEVYLEPLEEALFKRDLLDRLLRARAERRPVALVTDLVTGLKTLVFEDVVHGGFGLDEPDLVESRRWLADGRSAVLEPSDDTRLFVHCFTPPPVR